MQRTQKLLVGDALAVLKTLPSESVQCAVTSPPYWGLRDYGKKRQLGLERTPEEYVAKLVEVFHEVKRVLRADGTLWLNLGDSYNCSPAKGGSGAAGKNLRNAGYTEAQHLRSESRGSSDGKVGRSDRAAVRNGGSSKSKDLVGIPWMAAFALRVDGWYLRQDIIWAKPNPMPESVIDRCTKSHEYLFLLTKSKHYFFDAEAIKEPCVRGAAGSYFDMGKTALHQLGRASNAAREEQSLRNKRDVWAIATQPYKEAHFATFPEKLVEPCLRAGASERGCCPQCGEPYRRVVKRVAAFSKDCPKTVEAHHARGGTLGQSGSGRVDGYTETLGWEMYCACTVLPPAPCVVLDPFMGSGTVGAVSKRLGLQFVGIELNRAYIELARKRIGSA